MFFYAPIFIRWGQATIVLTSTAKSPPDLPSSGNRLPIVLSSFLSVVVSSPPSPLSYQSTPMRFGASWQPSHERQQGPWPRAARAHPWPRWGHGWTHLCSLFLPVFSSWPTVARSPQSSDTGNLCRAGNGAPPPSPHPSAGGQLPFPFASFNLDHSSSI